MLFTGGSISKGSLSCLVFFLVFFFFFSSSSSSSSSSFLLRCHISQNEGKLFKFMVGRNADCLARGDDAGVVREAINE